MATPKEAAVLFLTKVTLVENSPASYRSALEALLADYFPQDKMTDAKLEKIQAAYEKEVARLRKMYSTYLTGRGIK